MRNFVVLVNNSDEQIGVADKQFAHELGLLHRAFSVFVCRKTENGITEILIQKRSSNKYHCPGLWTNSCCSHPQPNELPIDAASSRLYEELGLKLKSPLNYKGSFIYRATLPNGLVEYEYDHVYTVNYEDEPINLDKLEVEEVKWVKVPQLLEDLNSFPQNYTPWFSKALTCANIIEN